MTHILTVILATLFLKCLSIWL